MSQSPINKELKKAGIIGCLRIFGVVTGVVIILLGVSIINFMGYHPETGISIIAIGAFIVIALALPWKRILKL